jgi:hypothetical protein
MPAKFSILEKEKEDYWLNIFKLGLELAKENEKLTPEQANFKAKVMIDKAIINSMKQLSLNLE